MFATLAVLLLPFAAAANQELMSLQNDDSQWALPSKNYSATRYSTLDQISATNVKKPETGVDLLHRRAARPRGTAAGRGTTMYVDSRTPTTSTRWISQGGLRRSSGSTRPTQDDRAVPVACCDLVHRGVNYAEGKILMTTLDGQVIALDATTGKEALVGQERRPDQGRDDDDGGPGREGQVIVGVSGGEFGVRGWVAAYDMDDGKEVWKAYSMGPDEDIKLAQDFNNANPHYGRFGEGTKTWPGEQWKIGGGTDVGLVRVRSRAQPPLPLAPATRAPGTPPRKGDNKWSMTIFARDPDTGDGEMGATR